MQDLIKPNSQPAVINFNFDELKSHLLRLKQLTDRL